MIGARVIDGSHGYVKPAQRQSEGFWTSGRGLRLTGMPNTVGFSGVVILTVVLVQRRERVFEREWRCWVVRKRRDLAERGVEDGRREGRREF